MRILTLFLLTTLIAMTSCKKGTPVAVDTTEAAEIPREVAIQKLGELLPTVEYTYCTLPKYSLKPSEIKGWRIRSDAVEIDLGKAKELVLSYADITQVRLELMGRYFTAKVFTSVQVDKEKAHFEFQWKQEEPAKRAVELFSSLKKK